MVVTAHTTETIAGTGFEIADSIAVIMEFFFMLSGFFMMSHIDNLRDEAETPITYVLHKIKGFFAPLCIANAVQFFIHCRMNGVRTIGDVFEKLWHFKWEFILLQCAGMINDPQFNKDYLLWPAWYLSAMMIALLLIYPLARYYRKAFTNIICPAALIFVYSGLIQKLGYVNFGNGFTFIVSDAVIRAIAASCAGVLCYDVFSRLRETNMADGKLPTVLDALSWLSIPLCLFFGCININDSQFFLMIPFSGVIIFSFWNATPVSRKLNSVPSGISGFLGKLSLYLYLVHAPVLTAVNALIADGTFFYKLLFVLLGIAVFTMLLYIVDRKHKSIRPVVIICAVCLLATFVSSAFAGNAYDVQVESTVMKDTKHNSALTALSIQEFENAGFQLGDSCDVAFGNGYSLADVPYYNGFYVNESEPVIVASKGSPTILITLDNIGIWDTAALTEGEKVTIRLNTSGKYASVQDVFNLQYSNDRTDYESDEQFSNFRAMTGGNLKADYFYRRASPVNNCYGRASCTDKLIAEKGIRFEVNLADSEKEMEAFRSGENYASPYATSLYENRQVVLLGLGSDYRSDDYRRKVAEGLRQMMNTEGPVYIHCTEGKDRTGFVCILLEALAEASYDEMRDDFMESYRNYFSVDKVAAPEKYNAIAELYFNDYIRCLLQSDEIGQTENINYSGDAAHYLISGGMTEEEVQQLKRFLTE